MIAIFTIVAVAVAIVAVAVAIITVAVAIIAVAVAIIAVAVAIVIIIIITIAAIFGTICAFCANWDYRIMLNNKSYHNVHAHTIETAETTAQQKCVLSIESSMYKGEREKSLWP
jgi:hypothetical protein